MEEPDAVTPPPFYLSLDLRIAILGRFEAEHIPDGARYPINDMLRGHMQQLVATPAAQVRAPGMRVNIEELQQKARFILERNP